MNDQIMNKSEMLLANNHFVPFLIIKYMVIVTAMLLSTIALAGIVSDPVKDNLSKYGVGLLTVNAKEFVTFGVDLNGDGHSEVFITNDTRLHHRSGYTWEVYISVKGGYVKNTGDAPSFFYDGIYYGYIDELSKVGIVNYHPASASDGSLIAYTFDDGRIVEHNLGTIQPEGDDKILYERYFNEKTTAVKIKKENIVDVMKRYNLSVNVKKPNKENYGKEELNN